MVWCNIAERSLLFLETDKLRGCFNMMVNKSHCLHSLYTAEALDKLFSTAVFGEWLLQPNMRRFSFVSYIKLFHMKFSCAS